MNGMSSMNCFAESLNLSQCNNGWMDNWSLHSSLDWLQSDVTGLGSLDQVDIEGRVWRLVSKQRLSDYEEAG